MRNSRYKLEHLESTSAVRFAASLNYFDYSHQRIDDASNRDEQERNNPLQGAALSKVLGHIAAIVVVA